jgi:hypothetical protein
MQQMKLDAFPSGYSDIVAVMTTLATGIAVVTV